MEKIANKHRKLSFKTFADFDGNSIGIRLDSVLLGIHERCFPNPHLFVKKTLLVFGLKSNRNVFIDRTIAHGCRMSQCGSFGVKLVRAPTSLLEI